MAMYYRSYKEESPMSEWGHAMFVDHNDSWVDTIGDGVNYVYDGTGAVDISNLEDVIKDAWSESLKNGDFDDTFMADITAEDAFKSFAPEDIVMSAEAWDDGDMVQWIWNKVLEPKGIYAVITPDGAIVFDESLIKHV